MSGSILPYLNLVTSEHLGKPKYAAMLAASLQPSADLIAIYNRIPLLYDVDTAVGSQLDVVGQWVGVDRNLTIPLVGIYFALDTPYLGFDQGVWQGPFDPTTGLTLLPDDLYRILIKVGILNNHWDGSISSAYVLINSIFTGFGYSVYIEDHCNLTMSIGIFGAGVPSGTIEALLTTGKFDIKPAGVKISSYFYQSAPGQIFAFDLNTSVFGGFGSGNWATVVTN